MVYDISDGNNPLVKWCEDKSRVYDLALSADRERLAVVVEQLHAVIIYNFQTRTKLLKWSYDDVTLTSIRISLDSRYLLISMHPNELKEVNIETGAVVGTYKGHKQKDWMIRSSFGGATEPFVVSGSEDSKIYIWRRNRDSERLQVLPGHDKGPVNAISWNQREPGMFASAGDDNKVRM